MTKDIAYKVKSLEELEDFIYRFDLEETPYTIRELNNKIKKGMVLVVFLEVANEIKAHLDYNLYFDYLFISKETTEFLYYIMNGGEISKDFSFRFQLNNSEEDIEKLYSFIEKYGFINRTTEELSQNSYCCITVSPISNYNELTQKVVFSNVVEYQVCNQKYFNVQTHFKKITFEDFLKIIDIIEYFKLKLVVS